LAGVARLLDLRRIEAGLAKHGKRFHDATLGACRGSLRLHHASGALFLVDDMG
jgi:hypothetical protein